METAMKQVKIVAKKVRPLMITLMHADLLGPMSRKLIPDSPIRFFSRQQWLRLCIQNGIERKLYETKKDRLSDNR